MAAYMKKRAIAEFTSVIQEPAPVRKKLRLQQPTPVPVERPALRLEGVEQDHIFGVLLQFHRELPLSSEEISQSVRILLDQLYQNAESFVRVKVLDILGSLVKMLFTDVSLIAKELLEHMSKESSGRVQVQILQTLLKCGLSQPLNATMLRSIVDLAMEYLTSSNAAIRAVSLKVISTIAPITLVKDNISFGKALKNFMQDPDPRVRAAAYQALLTWHQRGLPVDLSVYESACEARQDDYEAVRLTACRLVWILAQLHPNNMVSAYRSTTEESRLIDSAFACLCDMMNDSSVRVRTEAARLLGSLHAVGPEFLEQTLDKKLMSNLRVKKDAHSRQKQNYESGGWSSGKKWADDAPKEELEEEDVTLMSIGACGAFVHGLEDEYMEVRLATVDSVCELAARSPRFAVLCQDYLVDMFNDEIESVRLNAIYSLVKIAPSTSLREDQLDIMSSCLKEYSYSIREGLRQLFSHVTMATKSCLNLCILTLLDNLQRYPQDKEDTWRCMQKLGANHPYFTLALVPDLLSLHPYFESVEPEAEDPAYVAVLILVFNAAPQCPTMLPLFPQHTRRHYAYLRDTRSKLVPLIEMEGVPPPPSVLPHDNNYLQQVIERLSNLPNMEINMAVNLMEASIRDLKRTARLQPESSSKASLLGLFLEAQLLLSKVLNVSKLKQLEQSQEHRNQIFTKVLKLTDEAEHVYQGSEVSDICRVRELRLLTLAAHLMSVLTSSQAGRQHCIQFLQSLTEVDSYLASHGMNCSPVTQYLLQNMSELEQCQPSTTFTVVQQAVEIFKPQVLNLDSDVKKCRVNIIEPAASSDTVLKFTSGLFGAIHVMADINDITSVGDIRVKVKYPDQQVHYILPKTTDFRHLSQNRHRLQTTIFLSHGTWTEASKVEVTLCLSYSRNMNFGEEEQSTSKDWKVEGFLDVSNCVKVTVLPKPPKRC